MAPITQGLELDASQALDVINQLDQGLQDVATSFKVSLADALDLLQQPVSVAVEADTAAATSSIDALAEQPPVDVPVDADTGTAEQSIEALSQQPPVEVPVDANTAEAEQMILDLGTLPGPVIAIDTDTSAARGEIEGLREEVEAPVEMPIDADTSSAQESINQLGTSAGGAQGEVAGLATGVAGLEVAAGAAEGTARPLAGALSEIGPGAAAGGAGLLTVAGAAGTFFNEGIKAVGAGQRFSMILGEMKDQAETVNVDGLNTSLSDLGITFGSTNSEMENSTSRLYQFAVNSGVSQDEALQFTQQIQALGARAISLNPQLGNLSDVVDSLGTRIGRGGRFAQQYGLDLSTAEIATRAMANTGKTSAGELTFMEKALAATQLAAERYGSSVATDVAQGSQNAEVQLHSLSATFKEAVEQIGVPLVSPMFDTLRQAEPVAVLLGQDLALLAQDALPLVRTGLDLITPPLQLVSVLLTAINPVVEETANVLEALPTPVQDLVAAFLLLEFGGIVPLEAAFATLTGLAASAIATVLGWVGIGGAAAASSAAAATAVGAEGLAAEATAVEIEQLTLFEGEKVVADEAATVSSLELGAAMGAEGGGMAAGAVAGTESVGLLEVGVTGLAASLSYALPIIGAFIAVNWHDWFGDNNNADINSQTKLIQDFGVAVKGVADDGPALTSMLEEYTIQLGELGDGHDKATRAAELFDGVLKTTPQDAQRVLDGFAQLGIVIPDGQKKIDDLRVSTEAENQRMTDWSQGGMTGVTDAAVIQQQALDALIATHTGVGLSLINIEQNTGTTAGSMLTLAENIQAANLSQTEMATLAASLGVSEQQLAGFVKQVNDELDKFVSDAASKLPTAATAVDGLKKSTDDFKNALDPHALESSFQAQIDSINGFNLNMAFLMTNGYNGLAQLAATQGPAFLNSLREAIQNDPGMGPELEAKYNELGTLTQAEGPILRQDGEGIIVATGQIGSAASANFQGNLNVVAPTQEQIQEATRYATIEGVPFAQALAQVAGTGAVAFEQQFGQIPGQTAGTMGATRQTVEGSSPALAGAGGAAGGAAHSGFAFGVGGVPATAGQIFMASGQAMIAAGGPLSQFAGAVGVAIGHSFGQGIAIGINDYVGEIERSAANAVTDAENAARAAANSHSPSLLFADLGRDLALGMAAGMNAGTADVLAASSGLVSAAASGAAYGPGTQAVARQTTGFGSVLDAGAIGNPHVVEQAMNATLGAQQPLIGQVVIQLDAAASSDPAAARIAGDAAGKAFVDRVTPAASRKLLVGTKVL